MKDQGSKTTGRLACGSQEKEGSDFTFKIVEQDVSCLFDIVTFWAFGDSCPVYFKMKIRLQVYVPKYCKMMSKESRGRNVVHVVKRAHPKNSEMGLRNYDE